MLEIDGLVLRRGHRKLLGPLNFSAHAGRVTHVRGRNGVGKTTLMHVLAGLRRADAGVVRWADQDIAQASHHHRRALCYLGHRATGTGVLTPVESLRFALELVGEDSAQAVPALKSFSLRGPTLLQRLHTLSAGQQRRVALARLAVTRADLLLLDEPLNALDTEGRDTVSALLSGHAERGATVVVTSHQDLPVDADIVELTP